MTQGHAVVDLYLDRLPPWQQEICRELREIIRRADPTTGPAAGGRSA